jgi:hypothetical protein
MVNAMLAIGFALALAFIAYWIIGFSRITHDKSVSSDLQRLWLDGDQLQAGVVVAGNNRWTEHAFVADKVIRPEPGKKALVLILDDHYRGDDPTYRSDTGIIGDDLSPGILCSVDAQAAAKRVALDPLISRKIRSICKG